MSPITRMHRGLVLLVAAALVCGCTSPDDASKANAQEGQAASPAVAPEASADTNVAAAPTTNVGASAQAEPVPATLPTDAPPVAGPTTGESSGDADVDQQIQSLLGDSKPYREVFDQLQRGVNADDRKAVAVLVDYPLTIYKNRKAQKTVHNAKELVAAWDSIMTAEVKKVVQDQKYAELFVNQYGAMLGSGQVWINGICQDNTCTKTIVRISVINPDAPPAAP